MNEHAALRNQRIDEHRWLCRTTAARFVRPGVERADLEQVAWVGLIKAGDRYDERLGTPFHAFARQRILGELMHYVRDHQQIVRLPRSLYELQRREQKAQLDLLAQLDRMPSAIETAAYLQVDPLELDALYRALHQCNLADLDDSSQAFTRAPAVDEAVIVLQSLESLERDEQALLMAVYGLRLTQTEAGRRLGYTQRSASRLHRRALQKLSFVLGET